ncbi:uncharacterized protein MONBRDRAFT_30380 [Monosiga brevicollis MX1]|uniref:Protein kinase domain-containing protein n=1 Tax=Monosiga brevicollis TaxID=81824 RepID=A9VDT2_MONBE|nr:uncharacterized protein MONBRDRAFT_30380 [Monosiga brevicollis MX1]EDQ84314.1 predicted protein [Monosiga brevicollis MX1]|eukprot:XP_001750884.1 hypothetical protein [Monosiga brevicollis MX1]
MSDDGKQLYMACLTLDPQKALQLLTSWDQQRIRDAAQYKDDRHGDTPLHWACRNGDVKVVEMLLQHGADAKAKDNRGDTPLHKACRNGHVKVVEMLLKHGADAKAKNNVSTVPPSFPLYPPMTVHLYPMMMLMMMMLYLYVMLMHHPTVVEMLLQHGADAKAKDNRGDTPLHKACRNGHVKVVEMLLKHGADAKAKNNVSTVPPSFPLYPPMTVHLYPMMMLMMMMLYLYVMLMHHPTDGNTPLDYGRQRGHGDKLEPVFAAHEARLSQPPAPLAPPTPAPPSAWLPPLPTTPTLETTASVVVAVDTWLRPLLPTRTTSHTLPHLDAFISGAAKQTPNLATAVADIQRTIDEAPPEFPAMDWPAFQATTTQALGALDQALAAPEALNNRLGQLDPNTDNLEAVLQELHDVTAGFELQPVLLELQDVLAACPAPPTTLTMAPETPPANLSAALDKVAMLRDVGAKRIELFTNANSSLQQLVLKLITALRAVARAGATDTDHRVDTLEQCAQGLDVSAPPSAEALPKAWEELCQAHERLSLPEQNGLEQLITWRVEHDYENQDWYLAFALHEAQALVQQLQDMIDWQATTLSVLTSCIRHVDSLNQDVDDESVAAHEELTKVETEIQGFHTALQHLPETVRSGLEQDLKKLEKRRDTLRQQLSNQSHVDHVAELAQLLHQHFPALLVFLHPEQSRLGARLRTVLGPDLPASLILEAMTEVDRTLSLSSLGQLDLHYNQNHKVYKARAALKDSGEQDLAVKEYAFARQHKQDQCRTFLRELRAMRQLKHPHIIPVLGALVDVHSGHPSAYLVQPWCAQGDLQQWLSKARHMATSTVISNLMNQLRTALAFMHSKGLVHRDVKLSNIMLDGAEDQPVVRLGDFDIAKAAAEATMLPSTATASSGTAGYVAPEVLFGRGRVGARPAQDAFSFGCVLYNTYMFPQTVPPAQSRTDEVVGHCRWNFQAGDGAFSFPHLAAEMCDIVGDLYKETQALLAADPKQRPSLFSAGQFAERPVTTQVVGPAIDVLRDAPELISEVGELLKQLNTDGRGPANITVQRVERVHNPVLWERYSAKRREMLHRIENEEHYDQLQTSTLDAPSGSPALLRDASCQERLLLHGIAPDTMLRDKIVRLGLDYRFAGKNVGHRFGLGVYLTDHPGKSHRYTNTGPNGERMLIITRALLGHAFVHPSPPSGALAPPLLPAAPNNERYDSVVATPSGEFHEVVVFKNAQMYPELVEISMLIFMYLLLGKLLEHRLSSWLEKRGRLATSDDYAAFRRQTTTYLYRPTLQMCDATSGLYKETWACLQQISSSAQLSSAPARVCNAHVVGPAIDVLRDAPELVSEVAELLQQLSADGLGPGNAAGQRVARVQNPRAVGTLCFVIHPVKSAGCFMSEQSLRDKIVRLGRALLVAIYDHTHIYPELVVVYTRSNDAKLEAV